MFNSLALELLGVKWTRPRRGGIIGTENGVLTGYMEENAFLQYQQQVPMPDMEDLMEAYRRVQEQYASYGVTIVQEGMMPESLIPMYQTLLAHRLLTLDVVAYPPVDAWDEVSAAFRKRSAGTIAISSSAGARYFWMAPRRAVPRGCGPHTKARRTGTEVMAP